jgi:hypothetical protein
VGRKRTEYVVRFADDFKERSAGLDSFDVPASIFDHVEARPGPQLLTPELDLLRKSGHRQ